MGTEKRVLLSGVFGPFGVDDAFGRKENIMELFHNQVTKAQGMASLRYHHRTFGLYFLAENVQAPVKVLDFPTRQQFIDVLKSQRFDAVGLSFIVPNFVKAREMARLVRLHQPHAEVILGGHGAAIEGIETLIDCDHVVKGEGIRWLRRYLGEDPCAPIRHPALPPAEHKRLFGVPTPGVGALLVPGVGCVNGCRFCATSHFFGKEYTPFFAHGDDLYRQACRIADEMGTDDFFVMDENFLKSGDRARGLLHCMERDNRPFKFSIFSSSEAITSFGIPDMVRLGVEFVWLGAESKRDVYEKNKGRDMAALVKSLRDHGISVLVSGILFLDHHTPQNIQEDVDYIISLGGDFTQFMMFTPLPGTRLYQDYKADGRLDFGLPYEEWHGQHRLNFRHPAFRPGEETAILAGAFQREFDELSSSAYRMTDTALRGLRTLEPGSRGDPWLATRREQRRRRALAMRLLLPTLRRHAHDQRERDRVDAVAVALQEALGPLGLKERAMTTCVSAIAAAESVRRRLWGDMAQPRSITTRYRWTQAAQPAPAPVSPVRQPLAQVPAGES
jgi:hypothetical protein